MTEKTDLDAEYYVDHSDLQIKLARGHLSKVNVKRFSHVLDVGCGDGRITAMISRETPEGKVVGVDPSPSMIEFAKTHFSKEKFPNLEFVLKKIEDVAPTPTYDIVVAFNSFLWLHDGKRALAWLAQFLKPGGELLILTYPKESGYYQFLAKGLESYPEYKKKSMLTTMLRKTDYQEIVRENEQLEVLAFSSNERIITHEDEEEIKTFMKAWFTNFVPVPKEKQDLFLAAAVEGAGAFGQDQDGEGIHLPYIELVIHAKKK